MSAPFRIRAVVVEGDPTVAELAQLLAALRPFGASIDSICDAISVQQRHVGGTHAIRHMIADRDIHQLIDMVAAETGVAACDIAARRRSGGMIARPLSAVVWLAHRILRHSTPAIGEALDGRNHSTILYQVRRAEELRKTEDDYRALTDRLAAAITGEAA